MPTPTSITISAFAKVNLDLRIVGLLPDGYHDVRTVLQSVHLHDTLTVAAGRGPLAIRCATAGVPLDERNLAWKAIALLHSVVRGRRDQPSGLTVTIEKRIPAEAGLGGGSSDAAATLVAVSRLWGLDLDLPSLMRLGARLGADVPFFLSGGTAVGIGRGDEVSPLAEPPSTHIVIVKPAFGVSTAEAYRWFDEDPRSRRTRAARLPLDDWPAWATDLGNDLEPAVVRRQPRIRHAVAALVRQGAVHAAMSGSGSAVFGLFPDRETAMSARTALMARGWWAVATRTVGRATVARVRRRVLAGG
jgi:4-diphosphocytidyl-2-C-methyl-D-erythritol kinase